VSVQPFWLDNSTDGAAMIFSVKTFDFRAAVDREPAPMADACHWQAVLIHRDPEFTNLPETRESLSK
jgi:hypothetical protein